MVSEKEEYYHLEGEEETLARSVPWWMLIPWLIGGVTGGDFYITNSFIVANGGPLTVWGYLFAMIFVIMMSLIYWELVSAFPYSGGEYVYMSRALGSLPGYLVFFLYAFNFVFWIPLNLSVGGSYLAWIIGKDISPTVWSLVFAVIFHLITYRGILFSTLIQVIMSIIAILGTTLLLFVPMIINPAEFLRLAATNLNADFMYPTFSSKVTGVLALAGLCITYMVGFEVVPQIAEEIKASRSRFGYIQTLGSLGMGTIQILCALGMVAIIPFTTWTTLAGSEMNIPAAAMKVAPHLLPLPVVKIILFAEILSAFSTMLTAITGFTRSVYVMARDYRMPRVFAYLHPRYKTPVACILLSFAIGVFGSFQRWVVNYAFALVMATMFMYILIPSCHMILRKKEPDIERPAKTPFYPYINVIMTVWAVYMFWYQVKSVPVSVWYFLVGVVILGAVFYYIYDKPRKKILQEMGKTYNYGLPV